MRICIYGSSSPHLDPAYYEAGRALGTLMARHGHSMVFGGGCEGLMGAVAMGLAAEGGHTIGIAPTFFKDKGVLWEGCSEFIWTETMNQRKEAMEAHADAFVMTPGGIGTLEEFFEVLTQKQLGLHNKPIAVLNTKGVFDDLAAQMEKYKEEKFINPTVQEIYRIFATPEEVVDYLENYDENAIDVAHLKYI